MLFCTLPTERNDNSKPGFPWQWASNSGPPCHGYRRARGGGQGELAGQSGSLCQQGLAPALGRQGRTGASAVLTELRQAVFRVERERKTERECFLPQPPARSLTLLSGYPSGPAGIFVSHRAPRENSLLSVHRQPLSTGLR